MRTAGCPVREGCRGSGWSRSNKAARTADIVEETGLNSSDVLATLFELEIEGFVRQLHRKLFSKVLPQNAVIL